MKTRMRMPQRVEQVIVPPIEYKRRSGTENMYGGQRDLPREKSIHATSVSQLRHSTTRVCPPMPDA